MPGKILGQNRDVLILFNDLIGAGGSVGGTSRPSARECNGSDFNSIPNDRASLCMAATVVSMRVSARHAGFLLARRWARSLSVLEPD
jgi:hypothetical protein